MHFYFEQSFKFKQKQNWLKLIDKLIVTHTLYILPTMHMSIPFCNNLDKKDFVTKKNHTHFY